jgi:hypothetical protein
MSRGIAANRSCGVLSTQDVLRAPNIAKPGEGRPVHVGLGEDSEKESDEG